MINKLRSKIEKYVPISEEVWETVKATCEVVNVKNKEILIRYGELNRNTYFLAKGSFEMSLLPENEDAKTVWFFLDEVFDTFGAGDSLFLNEPTKYQITALEDSVVIKNSYETIDALAKKYHEFSEFLRQDMIYEFAISQEIRNHMISHSPIDFLVYLNQKFPAIFHRVPDKNIARFMGLTPEWYSKVKKKMKDLN